MGSGEPQHIKDKNMKINDY